MAKPRPRLRWRWIALACGLAVPWFLVWNRAAATSLLYPEGVVASVALAFGVFWVYRRVTDLVFLQRNDVGAALGRVISASFLVVLASFIFVQAAYAVKISGSAGAQETQALQAGVFLISVAGIYRALDVTNPPDRPLDSV